jgi:teichuronic acid exporter
MSITPPPQASAPPVPTPEASGRDGVQSHEGADLDRALVRGLVWFSTVKWGGQLITWGSTIIIARLLTPEDFGIIAAAMVVTGFLDLATNLGLGAAIIQTPQLQRRQTEQSMALSVLAAVAAAALLYFFAPLWGSIQGDSRIVAVLRVLGVAVVLTGIHVVPNALLSRDLKFEVVSAANLLQGITTAATSLSLAFVWRSYWALVVGYVVGKAIFTLTILVLRFVRPAVPRWSVVGGLVRFGGILTADRFLWYFRQHFDIIIVGAFLGARPLGLYSMAMTLARMPVEKISAVISPVLFPVFSRSQVSRTELHRQYGQTLAGLALVGFPAGLGMAAVSGDVVPIVLGSQWIPIIPLVSILALGTPFALLSSVNPVTLNAVGRVELSFLMSAVMAVVIPIAILIGTRWGLTGVAIAGIGVYVLMLPIWFSMTSRAIQYPLGEYRRILLPPAFGSLVMLVPVLIAQVALNAWIPGAALLMLKVLLGAGTYIVWMQWRDRTLVNRIWQRIRPTRDGAASSGQASTIS